MTDAKRWEVLHGDCLAVMRGMADASVDAVVTDPPYGTSESNRNKVTRSGNAVVAFAHKWDKELPLEWLSEVVRVVKPGGAVLAFTDNKRVGDMWTAGEAVGLKALHNFYWVKPDPPPTPRPNFTSAVESGVFFRAPGKVLAWNGGGATRNVFDAPLAHKEQGGQLRHHPTEKPVSLMRSLCRLVTPPNGLVLDPFTGSGTTGVAAMREGFNFVGIEREAKYVEIARRRCDDATRQGTLFGAAS